MPHPHQVPVRFANIWRDPPAAVIEHLERTVGDVGKSRITQLVELQGSDVLFMNLRGGSRQMKGRVALHLPPGDMYYLKPGQLARYLPLRIVQVPQHDPDLRQVWQERLVSLAAPGLLEKLRRALCSLELPRPAAPVMPQEQKGAARERQHRGGETDAPPTKRLRANNLSPESPAAFPCPPTRDPETVQQQSPSTDHLVFSRMLCASVPPSPVALGQALHGPGAFPEPSSPTPASPLARQDLPDVWSCALD